MSFSNYVPRWSSWVSFSHGLPAALVPAARVPAALVVTATLAASLSLGSGCSPYPDDGEFLAGVVYANNFIRGVKTIDQLPAIGRGQAAADFAPYTVVATTSGNTTTTAATTGAVAAAPFWTDATKRNPLARETAGQAIAFLGGCAYPSDYSFDERLDLVRMDRQYPLFADLPEQLTANNGKPGRRGAYSAVVEVIYVRGPGSIPCQSIKRFDTALGRIGKDLTEVRREFRLLQIIDTAIALRPLPFQLGFFNQLVTPYIDMGPVPLSADGKTFATMPLYKVTVGTSTVVVVPGTATEAAATGYSPICQDYTLTGMTAPPDVSDPIYKGAKKTDFLSSCLVCKTADGDGHLDCPFAADPAR